jgi:hypothetical protein
LATGQAISSLALANCVQDQLDAAGDFQLLKDPVNVVSGGVSLYVESLGNLTVFHTVGDQANHFHPRRVRSTKRIHCVTARAKMGKARKRFSGRISSAGATKSGLGQLFRDNKQNLQGVTFRKRDIDSVGCQLRSGHCITRYLLKRTEI